MHKVPLLLRQENRNSDAYDPKVVSFGPYHHRKEQLQHCEEAKQFALQMFVEGGNQRPEFFYTKVLEEIAGARNCYVEGSTDNYTDEQFAEMMLLDACFLICYICILPSDPRKCLLMFNYLGGLVHSLVIRDMFLLENQIPYQIVMLLVNLRYNEKEEGKNKGEEAVRKFLHATIWGKYKKQQIEDTRQHQLRQPLHLLEAFRGVLVWDWTPENQVVETERQEEDDVDFKKHQNTFRSAMDLKAKGIHFKPSCNRSLEDIKFSSFFFYAQLQLPTWFVSNLSKVFFLNMIAYELCPNNLVETTVISYINFMKSLVERPADVKELREKRILFTSLGSDKEVVRLYKDLNTYGVENTYGFVAVKQRIQEHYDSRTKTWIAQLFYTYFSSPWSIIGWLAAVFLLVLSFLQTYFTINPPD